MADVAITSIMSFRFKQFTIQDDRCAMKVGTDGVLLGAWCPTGLHILDVGTGSGLIARMLMQRCPEAQVEGIDINAAAVEQACENGVKAFCARLQEWQGQYDLIVSNPPYITESERPDMEHTVLDYEPHTALFVPDNDPLLFYRTIADFCRGHLSFGGVLYFEINPLYAAELVPMFRYKGFSKVELRNDISGKSRFIKCILDG